MFEMPFDSNRAFFYPASLNQHMARHKPGLGLKNRRPLGYHHSLPSTLDTSGAGGAIQDTDGGPHEPIQQTQLRALRVEASPHERNGYGSRQQSDRGHP